MTFKKKLLLNIGVSLIVALVLGMVLFFFDADVKNKTEYISEARKELNLRSQIAETLDSLRRESKQAELYSAELEKRLPTKDGLVNFSQDLNAVAQQNQMNLKLAFGAETPKTQTAPGEIKIILTINGTLKNFAQFLKDLENSRYSIKLEKLDLNKKEDKFEGMLSGAVLYF